MQSDNANLRAKLCLTVLCFILTGGLLLGVTYGRYRQELAPMSYQYTAEEAGALILGGVVTQDWIDKGLWPSMPSVWSVTGSSASLEFSVSNGQSTMQYTQRSQGATVRLVAGLGIGDPENLTVKLSYTQGEETVTLTGQAEPINNGSLVHKNYGDGWIYRFYDAIGNEKTFYLSGGKLSYQNLTISLEGEQDPVLCQLQVQGKYID